MKPRTDVQLLAEIRDLLKANLQDGRLARRRSRRRGKQVNKERTVLIVDDHPHFRQALRDALAFLAPRWQIVEAGDGQEGLTLAQRLRPDLILLDLYMPVMDGYAMVMALQSDPTLAAIPRVLLTGEKPDHPLVVRLRLLCQAVVSKPVNIADLAAALQQVLSQ